VAFIRHPLDRFISAMAQMGQSSIDTVMSAILSKGEVVGLRGRMFRPHLNPHFLPQIIWVTETSILYRFPEHLQQGAELVGLSWPLPVINTASVPKQVPTTEQEQSILSYYQEDLELYDAISQPGIVTGMVAQRNYEIPTRFGQSMMDGFTGQP